MGIITKLKNRIFRKLIYIDAKSSLYRLSTHRYFYRNSGVSSGIQLCSDNERQLLLFNVKNDDNGRTLINFSVLYDPHIPIEKFIITHCLDNPIFMIDPQDIASIKDCTTEINKQNSDRSSHPVFINRVGLNRKKFEDFLKNKDSKKNLHSYLFARNELYSDGGLNINKNSVFIHDVEYQLIVLKKKKVTQRVNKVTLSCFLSDSNKITDILTVYDINGVVCVLKNIFDMVTLGIDKEWLLYTDRQEVNTIISEMFYYLHLYIDLCAAPLLFHKNSPCKISRNKDNFILDYIDGYRSAEVNVLISRRDLHLETGIIKPITKIDMNVFFHAVFKTVALEVFTICLKHPSNRLLKKLDELGFDDCTIPLDRDIIEVLKMYDYE